MDTHTISDAPDLSIATVPPTAQQRQLSLIVAAIVLAATGVITPFGATQLPQIDGIIPAFETVIFVSDLFTAALLSSHARIIGSHRLLVLASGYFFSALMVAAHVLTFPGAFAPSGLLGAGLQTAPWLFIFWHLGFPASIIVYVCLKDEKRTLPRSTIYWSAALVVLLALLLTWFATVHHDILPLMFADQRASVPFGNHITGIDLLTGVIALALLWRRQKSVLDLWLTVAVVCMVAELWVNTFVIGGRYSLGFYVARFLSVTVSAIVLLALLTESTVLYARLSNANALLRRERANRLMNVEAATAAIAHEVRQPLSAIMSFGGAALNRLKRMPPDLEKIRECVASVIEASGRADKIISSVRALYGKATDQRTMIDVTDIVRQALNLLKHDLQVNQISVATEFQQNLPTINANGTQIYEVILNLIKNAVDAMDSVPPGKRRLQLAAKLDKSNSVILLSIEDSGHGIVARDRDRIFDPFFTTKAAGTGLGLSLCRVMIEDHGGHLRLIKTDSSGSIFEIVLPIGSTSESRI
jgi:signal transduction histidine kinase